MRSITPASLGAAAVLLVLPVGLTGCSFGSSSADKAPVSSSAAAPSSQPSAAPGTGSGEAASGKPTKEQVKTGLNDYFVGKGVPRALMSNVADCVVDDGYDKFSDTTLRALQSGQIDKLNPLDAATLASTTTTCLARGAGSAVPSVS
ncbi:hypothetical protein HJ588_12650 [Flexivirga sp. ID2601S]|uniref:DUF732 domain-containing protein n=1 Tax=Flexivirga aerilata TaxID=1656889 RepID=A0A849AJE0_9MICO|nr:hypothetical protein [Flexivirga aerilata]NNG40113.1 hypothetical protein [Flexivirga aerilata]